MALDRPDHLRASIGGDTITLSEGSVSGFTTEAGVDGRAWVKSDATIAGGVSGGTAVNEAGELVAIPGFQKPGTFSVLFDDGNFTRFDGSFGWKTNGEPAQIDLWFESALVGQYQQDYAGVEGAVTGVASRLSVTFAFEQAFCTASIVVTFSRTP